MQILHRFAGSIQRYSEELSDPDRYRPDHCPQCETNHPLRAHGFYTRTLVDIAYDGTIRVRRYFCRCCKRTVSLLPEFAMPYLRFGVVIIALFLVARLLLGLTLKGAAEAAKLVAAPYQRGQFWVRRFRREAQKLCAALAAFIAPPAAPNFSSRAKRGLRPRFRFRGREGVGVGCTVCR
jgi:transposase-like protein